MRTIIVFVAGILVGVAIESGLAQQARGPQRGSRVGVAGSIVGLNHVAVSVADYTGAIDFYGTKMGFRQAFSFQEPDGSPYLTYFQINRDTFVEVMQATPARPVGCPHFGLEVEHLDSAVEQLRRRGVEVRAPSLSPRTGSRIAVATAPGGVNIEMLEFGSASLHRKVIESWKVESRK